MTTKRGRRRAPKKNNAKPKITDHEKVQYQDVRDQFLNALPTEREEVEWLVKVGAFVQHCWLAEESERKNSDRPEELDEHALWHLWDECSNGQIEDMQVKAVEKLVAYRRRKAGVEIRKWAARTFKPIELLVNGTSWFLMQSWRGFVSGVGLILLGLLLVWIAPETVKRMRGTMNALLPEVTRPAEMPDPNPNALE